jgi:cell division septation protein DedD
VRYPFLIPISLAIVLVLAGCGSTDESAVDEQTTPTPHSKAPIVPPRVKFETRTDTVTAVHAAGHSAGRRSGHEPLIRFMVQIGAFKDPQHASTIQTVARERYRMPVLNDYQTRRGLYQIRIGFFESRESANAFRARMIHDYPQEYKDSWVVQLKR